MQFSTLKTTLASWLNRDDLTSYLDDFINITLQKLETRYNWKYMEYRATATKTVTGAPTAADAYITLPNSGKMKAVEFLRCYPSTSDVGTWMKQVDPKTALDMWPNLTYDIGQPQVYFIQRDTSEFCVRPTPDQTYIFDILCYNFSSDTRVR